MRANRKQHIVTAAYVCCVLFITLFSREMNLIHRIEWIPFWSVYDWIISGSDYGISFFLNIALFIPLGYYLAELSGKAEEENHKGIAVAAIQCFALSLIIEVIQFVSYRGLCDIDDLISNTLGGAIGATLYRKVKVSDLKRIIPYGFIAAGIVGCIFIAISGNVESNGLYERQMAFDIGIVERVNNTLSFSGDCYLYEDAIPEYQVVLVDEKTGALINAKTTIDADKFAAIVQTADDADYEVKVLFKHRKPISTGTYIHGNKVEYVPAGVPEPENVGELTKDGILKAYNAENDVYVYQIQDKIVWLIGNEIPERTEIIYHLHTNEPDKLPEARQKYKSDNLGFMADKAQCKLIGKYRVFEAAIPNEYPITAIGVGYSTQGIVSWKDYFRPLNRFN